jgi:putative flippase GtrA
LTACRLLLRASNKLPSSKKIKKEASSQMLSVFVSSICRGAKKISEAIGRMPTIVQQLLRYATVGIPSTVVDTAIHMLALWVLTVHMELSIAVAVICANVVSTGAVAVPNTSLQYGYVWRSKKTGSEARKAKILCFTWFLFTVWVVQGAVVWALTDFALCGDLATKWASIATGTGFRIVANKYLFDPPPKNDNKTQA